MARKESTELPWLRTTEPDRVQLNEAGSDERAKQSDSSRLSNVCGLAPFSRTPIEYGSKRQSSGSENESSGSRKRADTIKRAPK